ncbi:MAG: hypothetical protein IJE14_00420 [Clostridia bacterium]|nr:hypothetical protein [Clostridia bacterium]
MIITSKDFEQMIPDPEMRFYLSGGCDEDTFLTSAQDFVRVFQNTITLAFIYAFSCYLHLSNNTKNKIETQIGNCIKNGNSNAMRVIRTMQSIYKKYPLSTELMQFVIADIYYDFLQGGDACLGKYFPNCVSMGDYWDDKNVGLNEYFSFINENAESSRITTKGLLGEKEETDFTLDIASEYLRIFIDFFPFLKTTSLKFDELSQWYTFVINNYNGSIFRTDSKDNPRIGIIDTFDILKKIKMGGSHYCILTSIDSNSLKYETPRFDRYVTCSMVGVSGKNSISKFDPGTIAKPYNIATDHETMYTYLGFSISDVNNSVSPTTSMDQIFNINYKYMKNLSLAIADAIGKKQFKRGGERLWYVFSEKFPHAFESYTKETKNWDSIVVILLIEAGPSMVLREVFYALDDDGDDEIVRNLRRRFGKLLSNNKLFLEITNGEEFTEKAISLLGNHYIENHGNVEIEKYNRELIAKAKTHLVLTALTSSDENIDSHLANDCFHTNTIQQYIIILENAKKTKDAKLIKEYLESFLSDTFKRLICFYSGIFAYGEEKIKFDNESRTTILSDSKIKKFQLNAEAAFQASAEACAKSLKNITSATELISKFVDLCNSCCQTQLSVAQTRSTESKLLYAVLGKKSIMDMSLFNEIIDINTAKAINEENIDYWFNTTIKIFRFLLSGILEENDSRQNSFNAISPMVASYNNHSDSKDGYDTSTFTLIFDAKEIDGCNMEINMLSEFAYDINMRYYCLPNIVRSNNTWWIDPFVFKCSDFDKIFLEG